MISRAQRWFVPSRIYSLAPVKYLLTRVMRKQLSQKTPFERHVGLVGAPADGFRTRVVCDVNEKEDFATTLRLVQKPCTHSQNSTAHCVFLRRELDICVAEQRWSAV